MTRPSSIATTRLILRAPVLADAAAYLEVFGDFDANAAANPRGYCRDLAEAQVALEAHIGRWARHGFDIWAVCLKGDPQRVVGFGGVGWRAFGDEQRLNLGYGLHRSLWGQGFAKELADAAVRFAREDLAAPVLWARVQAGNAASRRVLASVGMAGVANAAMDGELVYSARLAP